jgi:hypothetical protein
LLNIWHIYLTKTRHFPSTRAPSWRTIFILEGQFFPWITYHIWRDLLESPIHVKAWSLYMHSQPSFRFPKNSKLYLCRKYHIRDSNVLLIHRGKVEWMSESQQTSSLAEGEWPVAVRPLLSSKGGPNFKTQ